MYSRLFTNALVIVLALLCTMRVCAQGYLAQGNRHYRDGKLSEASGAYRMALKLGENPALSWFNLGNVMYQRDSIAQAVSCYKAAVIEEPAFSKAWQNLGILYYQQQDYAASVAVLEHLLRTDKKSPLLLTVLAAAHMELDNYGMAAVYMQQALEIDSSHVDGYLLLYKTARATGDTKEALSWLSRYPSDGARAYDVLLTTGELSLSHGDSTAAMTALREAVRLQPTRSRGWVELISLLHRMEVTYTALTQAQEALSYNPRMVDVALLAGEYAFESKYYDKAESFYMHAYAHNSVEAIVGLSNLQLVYNRFGDRAGMQRIRQALKQKKYGDNDENGKTEIHD